MDFPGDGKHHTVGPFETAQRRFYRTQTIPLCAGGFGEINKDFEKISKLLAREAVSGEVGLTISPLVNTDWKGSAFPTSVCQ